MMDEDKPITKGDWVLLPALSLLTIGLIIFTVEMTARIFYAESKSSALECLVLNDASTGVRGIPNSACSQKIAESDLVLYKFNSCGHRAGMECKPKAADTYRIVMVGSSFNYGMWVPREQSFAALLPLELSQLTGRKIELYNEAMQWGFPRSVDLRFGEVLAAKPDMILWPLTPMDIGNVDMTLPWVDPPPEDSRLPTKGLLNRLTHAITSKSPKQFLADTWKRMANYLNGTRTVFMLQHFIFKSQSQFVKQYLMQADSSDYLRANQSAVFQENLRRFAQYYADVQSQANRIGATVVVTVVPERAQASIISMKQWPAEIDPFKLGNNVRDIVTKGGGDYLDLLAYFSEIPNPELKYMPVDGHPTVEGHAMISDLLAKALTQGVKPVLSRSDPLPSAAATTN